MLGYADTTRAAARKVSPPTLALIVAGHAVLLGAVMSARMAVTASVPAPIEIDFIPLTPDPPPVPPEPLRPPTQSTRIDRPRVVIPLPPLPGPWLGNGPTIDPLPIPGPTLIPTPSDPISATPVRIAARLATPESLIRPPYPDAKRRLEQEARLTLRLRIDERGRVIAVDPVGRADPAFLDSARRHLIQSWRYKPATEDGRAVATTITVALRFELEDA